MQEGTNSNAKIVKDSDNYSPHSLLLCSPLHYVHCFRPCPLAVMSKTADFRMQNWQLLLQQ